MKIKNYNYPIIAFKEGDKNIYATKNDFGIVSKGGDKFYKNLSIIDSKGNIYKLNKAKINAPASFFTNVRNFQKMWEMDLEFEEMGTMKLDELKEKILAHIEPHPKHWLVLDTIDGLKERVNKANSFKELILMFE